MKTNSPDIKRRILTNALVNPEASTRYAVGQEERRVEDLLDERYIDPYAGSSRTARIGREILAKATSYTPKQPQLIERPYLEEQQEKAKWHIADELQVSREVIRDNLLADIDGIAIDGYLGLRTEQAIIPPLFQELHQQAETSAGKPVSFLEWMADYATDDQLLNVWQWHDDYLEKLDTSPEFQERIARVKADYQRGTDEAIKQGILHPSGRIDDEDMEQVRIIHASPFSPNLPGSHAFADRAARTIQLNNETADYTLYHELTHLNGDGLVHEFDEGVTDLRASAIYNLTHSADEAVDPRQLSYADQIKTLDSISRLGNGKIDLYTLSELSSGPDAASSSIELVKRVDEELGYPLLLAIMQQAQLLKIKYSEKISRSVFVHASQVITRESVEFMEAMLSTASGGQRPKNLRELTAKVISKETIGAFGTDRVFSGLSTVRHASELQEK